MKTPLINSRTHSLIAPLAGAMIFSAGPGGDLHAAAHDQHLSTGNLQVTVKDTDGTVRDNAEVVRYDQGWGYLDTQVTDALGETSWSAVPEGSYHLEAYFQGAYWGCLVNVAVPESNTASVVLNRNMPAVVTIRTVNAGGSATSIFSQGETVTVEIDVSHLQPAASFECKVEIDIDRTQTPPYDYDPPRSTALTVAPSSITTFSFDWTPAEAGVYSVNTSCYTILSSNDVLTDLRPWDTSFTVTTPEPDLVPYQPAGWSDSLILSHPAGTNKDTTLCAGQPVYLDYAIANNGSVATSDGFRVEVWDDTTSALILREDLSDPLAAYGDHTVEDTAWTFMTTGWHTIRLTIDTEGAVDEGINEGNNSYEKLVYVTPAPAQRTIEFAGLEWNVKGGAFAPGTNYWSNSEESVWVDTAGLHLKLRRIDGAWHCAEVSSVEPTRYGMHRFYLNSRVDQLDRNVVLGLFLYRNDWTEIDIEFSRWGDPNGDNGWYVLQPAATPGNTLSFPFSLSDDNSTHYFDWGASEIIFKSIYGHHAEPPDAGYLIREWTYTGADIPLEHEDLRIHMNLWLMDGNGDGYGDAPSDGQDVEIIISAADLAPAFTVTPSASPAPSFTHTIAPTPTPTVTPSPVITPSVAPTATPSPIATPSPTASSTVTASPIPHAVLDLTVLLHGTCDAGRAVAGEYGILVELRDSADGGGTNYRYADMALDSSGAVAGGTLALGAIAAGDYYLVVDQLNHLAVRTTDRLSCAPGVTTTANLSDPASPDFVPCDGSLYVESGGMLSLFAGNGNKESGQETYVNVLDALVWIGANGTTPGAPGWDIRADFDANGLINVLDALKWMECNGAMGSVSTGKRRQ